MFTIIDFFRDKREILIIFADCTGGIERPCSGNGACKVSYLCIMNCEMGCLCVLSLSPEYIIILMCVVKCMLKALLKLGQIHVKQTSWHHEVLKVSF